jgi:hypothetical protein
LGRLPRNYAPIDTNLFSDSKIRGLSPGAKLLFVASLLDCNKEMTDGQLKRADVDHLARLVKARNSCRTELLSAGLWLESGTGFEVVGFLGHNKSRAEREAAAEAAAKRKREWLENRGNGVPNGVLEAFPIPKTRKATENQRTKEAEQQSNLIGASVA